MCVVVVVVVVVVVFCVWQSGMGGVLSRISCFVCFQQLSF